MRRIPVVPLAAWLMLLLFLSLLCGAGLGASGVGWGQVFLASSATATATVGWETVVERDPDVIVICNYGDVSAEQKRRFLLSYAPLKNVSAVKNKRVFVLDYVDLVESPRNPSAIARLGTCPRSVADTDTRPAS